MANVDGMVSLGEVTNLFFNARSRGDGPASVDLLEPGLIHADFDDEEYVFLIQVRKVQRRLRRFEPPLQLGLTPRVSVSVTRVETSNYVTVTLSVQPQPNVDSASAVQVIVHDDVGTPYFLQAGEDGGGDNPLGMVRRFRPQPPSAATTLQITVVIDGQMLEPARMSVTLPLSDDEDDVSSI